MRINRINSDKITHPYGINPDTMCTLVEAQEAARIYEAAYLYTENHGAALAAVWKAARNYTAEYYEKLLAQEPQEGAKP